MLAQLTWAEMEKEIPDTVIANTRANATHICLLHNPVLSNGESDWEAMQRKKACFAITKVLIHSWLDFWIKE